MADEREEQQDQKTRTGAEQAAALDKVTDMVEEKELDTSKTQKAMQALAASRQADLEAQRQRERELAAVKVSKEDIDLIAEEYEIDRKKAELRLRECKGDLKAALHSFLKVA